MRDKCLETFAVLDAYSSGYGPHEIAVYTQAALPTEYQ